MQEFFEGVQAEMKKVTWPDREQLRNATAVILVFVIVLAIIHHSRDHHRVDGLRVLGLRPRIRWSVQWLRRKTK